MRWYNYWFNSNHITVPMDTQEPSRISLLSPGSTRIPLNYRDICQNSFYIETHDEDKEKYILFTICNRYKSTFSVYHQNCTTHTSKPVAHVAYKIVFQNVIYMTNLAHSPWSFWNWLEMKTISNSINHAKNDVKL